MLISKKGIASIAAAFIFAGSIGCVAVNNDARFTADSYINAVLAMDIGTADSLCQGGDSGFSLYLGNEYKTRAVGAVLNATHFRFEKNLSGQKRGEAELTYTLVMPDLNRALDMNPACFDEFVTILGLCGKTDVTVTVDLRKESGSWLITNSGVTSGNLYGSLFAPEYEFMIDSASVFENEMWSSSSQDGAFNDVRGISCHYDLRGEFLDTGLTLDLTYEYCRNGERIFASQAVYDEDGRGVSFPLDVSDTSLAFDFLPQFDYELKVYNSGNLFCESHKECTLSPGLFPDATAIDAIAWQHTSRDGNYYNCSDLDAKIWLDPVYIDSGRPVDITFDIFFDGEVVYRGGQARVYGAVASCVYEGDILDTGDYSINIYNNGTFCGSSAVKVVLNLSPENYLELDRPDSVADVNTEPRASLEIFTPGRNVMDVIGRYTDVRYNSRSVSMNIFNDHTDSVLASGEGAPDLIICDSSYASRYAVSDMMKPVNEIGISYSELQYMYEYTFALGSDDEGVIKGVTWEITPGAVFYSRTAAMTALGVSEPGDVTPYFESWDSFINTAESVKADTDGSIRILADPSDISTAYIFGRTDSWFDDDGEVAVPQYLEDYMLFAKLLTDEELTFEAGRWSSSWTSRISNRTALAFPGTLRFGQVFLKQYHPGDWGVVMPPVSYYDGGSFIFVTKYCDMDASAARFIRDITINENNLMELARDGYTVNNLSIMTQCSRDDDFSMSWLDGQNPYRVFSQVAWGIDASVVSSYDEVLNSEFDDAVTNFVYGNLRTPEAAIEQFEENVSGVFG